jgi:hypothetical protein
MMSNWEGYPNRFNSVICSTTKKRLDLFGSLIYRVIPIEENSKVAFAPNADVWASFNDYALKQAQNYRLNLKMNPSDFGTDISKYFYPKRKGKNLQNISLEEFKQRVKDKEHTDLTMINWANRVNFFGSYMDKKEAHKERFFRDFEGIWEFLVDAYDPDKNGFELLEYNNSTIPTKQRDINPSFQGLECWTDAKCLMIFEDFA